MTNSPPVLRARVLQLLLDGVEWSRDRLEHSLAVGFEVEVVLVEKVELHPLLHGLVQHASLDVVLKELRRARFISCPHVDDYRITPLGRLVAEANPQAVPDKLLVPEFEFEIDGPSVMYEGGGGDEPQILQNPQIYLEPDGAGLAGLGTSGGGGAGLGGGMGTTGFPGKFGKGSGVGPLDFGKKAAPRDGAAPRKKGKPGDKSPIGEAAAANADYQFAPLSAPAMAEPPIPNQPVDRDDGGKDYTVWYGTNRVPLTLPDGRLGGYSGERDTRLHLGTCRVLVPEWHKFGTMGTDGLKGWYQRNVRGKDDRLTVVDLRALEPALFWSSIKSTLELAAPKERIAVVYIHGYNVSFESAAIRAAQMGVDLKVPGAMAFYSWPSTGWKTAYTWDEAAVEGAEQYLTEFLTTFAAKSGAARVDVIAHSMGNRGLLRSVVAAEQGAGIKFGQIILAAPDVDAGTFRNLAGVYPKVGERTTLYVSQKDKALWFSQFGHGYARAGYQPPLMVLPEIDTIEVSNLDVDFLGHSYYGDAEGILYDMHQLIWTGLPPKHRSRLLPAGVAPNAYWTVRAGKS